MQLRSLHLLHGGHLDVPGPVGRPEWRRRLEVRAAKEENIHRDVVGGHLDDPPNTASPTVLGVSPSGTAGWLLLIALAVIGAPLIEELFFRGLVQDAFTRRIGAVPALFVTAIIFSFAHILNEGLLAPLALFPMAVVLGYLRYRTNRLAAGMVAHALFNASVFLLFLVPAFR